MCKNTYQALQKSYLQRLENFDVSFYPTYAQMLRKVYDNIFRILQKPIFGLVRVLTLEVKSLQPLNHFHKL